MCFTNVFVNLTTAIKMYSLILLLTYRLLVYQLSDCHDYDLFVDDYSGCFIDMLLDFILQYL